MMKVLLNDTHKKEEGNQRRFLFFFFGSEQCECESGKGCHFKGRLRVSLALGGAIDNPNREVKEFKVLKSTSVRNSFH